MKKLNYEKVNMQGKNRENHPFSLPARVEPGTSIKKNKTAWIVDKPERP